MSHPSPESAPPGGIDYVAVEESPRFVDLKKRHRSFVWPLTIAFLVWYFAYVLLSTYAEGLMSTPVLGNLNLGLLMGISQFLMTFLITWLYIRHANRHLDPIAEKLRDELEGEH